MPSLELDSQGRPVLMGDEPDAPDPDETSHREARRRDAVRSAAREFETLSVQDLRERFRGTDGDIDDVELGELVLEVREAQLDDLVDILDDLRHGKLRARRHVRLASPKGYLRKTLWALNASEYAELKIRLVARGWTEKDLDVGLDRRLSNKKLKELTKPTHGVTQE